MEQFDELFNQLKERMSGKNKQAFREYATKHAKDMGYNAHVEKSFFAKNLVVGDVDKADYIFTAHYDTPPQLPSFFVKHMYLYSFLIAAGIYAYMELVPSAATDLYIDLLENSTKESFKFFMEHRNLLNSAFAVIASIPISFITYSVLHLFGLAKNPNKTNFNDNTSGVYTLFKLMDKYKNLPKEKRDKVAFVFFDNEEKALLGSFAHAKKHRKGLKDKTYINLDCVGLGKQMNLYHFGKETKVVEELEKVLKENGLFVPKSKPGTIFSLSDHFPLRKSNHVCMLATDTQNKNSLYDEIHSSNDMLLDIKNIDDIVKTISNLPYMQELIKKQPEISKCTQLVVVPNKTHELIEAKAKETRLAKANDYKSIIEKMVNANQKKEMVEKESVVEKGIKRENTEDLLIQNMFEDDPYTQLQR